MRNHLIYFVLLLLTIPGSLCFAKTDQKEVKEDFKTASNVQPGKEYAQVNSEGRVRVQIAAPEAEKVQLDISAVKYDLVKDEKGVWTGESDPQNEGFHYYLLWIDCVAVTDPGSNSVMC